VDISNNMNGTNVTLLDLNLTQDQALESILEESSKNSQQSRHIQLPKTTKTVAKVSLQTGLAQRQQTFARKQTKLNRFDRSLTSKQKGSEQVKDDIHKRMDQTKLQAQQFQEEKEMRVFDDMGFPLTPLGKAFRRGILSKISKTAQILRITQM